MEKMEKIIRMKYNKKQIKIECITIKNDFQ